MGNHLSAKRQEKHARSSSIGIYGGTFDPIHFGHLNLAIELMEKNHLDEVWFLPARRNPHKGERVLAASEHSLRMVEIAISPIPQFSVLKHELLRPDPSYTIDTIEELLAAQRESLQPPVQFHLLLGADALERFPFWHRVLDLVRLVPLLIGERVGSDGGALFPKNLEDSSEGLEIIQAIQRGRQTTRCFDISSTEIRSRIAQGRYCGHLVPEKVLDYIHAHGLYYCK